MIYYFSGTGNSRRVAQWMGKYLNDSIQPILSLKKSSLSHDKRDYIGFVFPVYAWGLPVVVEKFLNKIPVTVFSPYSYIYFVLTCGDDIGRTDELIRNICKNKGITSPAIFSIRMRNTYVCLPGFDIDPILTENQKENDAKVKVKEIASRILLKDSTSNSDITPGDFPWIKSYILRPLFNRFLIKDKLFHVDTTRCIHCRICENICPLNNITMDKNKFPEWNGKCTHCLACFHSCPQHAINYGKYTRSKGQVKINF